MEPERHLSVNRYEYERPGTTRAAWRISLVGAQLQNITVMVAEDDPLLADDLLNILTEAGAVVAGPASNVKSALDLPENAKPDCAILNAGVAYQTAMGISKRLNELGIPYLIQSGHSEQKLPDDLKGSRFLAKPIERRRLVESVAAMLADKR